MSDLGDNSIGSIRQFNGLEAVHVGASEKHLYLTSKIGSEITREKIPLQKIDKIQDTAYGVLVKG